MNNAIMAAGEASDPLKTLFTQEMLRRGILSSGSFCCPTYAHKSHHVDVYLQACGEVFHLLAAWLKEAGGVASSPQLYATLEGGARGTDHAPSYGQESVRMSRSKAGHGAWLGERQCVALSASCCKGNERHCCDVCFGGV